MRNQSIFIALVIAMLIFPLPGQATTIFYDLQHIGGDVWQYDYLVRNDSLTTSIKEFTIYFDFGLYDALRIVSVSSNWTQQAFDPPFVNITTPPQNGFFNAIASTGGIAPGTEAGGFSVSFLWLDAPAVPASQWFDTVPLGQFDLSMNIEGWTEPLRQTPVPEPDAILFISIALSAAMLLRRRQTAGRS